MYPCLMTCYDPFSTDSWCCLVSSEQQATWVGKTWDAKLLAKYGDRYRHYIDANQNRLQHM